MAAPLWHSISLYVPIPLFRQASFIPFSGPTPNPPHHFNQTILFSSCPSTICNNLANKLVCLFLVYHLGISLPTETILLITVSPGYSVLSTRQCLVNICWINEWMNEQIIAVWHLLNLFRKSNKNRPLPSQLKTDLAFISRVTGCWTRVNDCLGKDQLAVPATLRKVIYMIGNRNAMIKPSVLGIGHVDLGPGSAT